MKKLASIFLALFLILGTTSAMADPKEIDGLTPRNITINPAGLNPSAEEMIAQGISPTTGRKLSSIKCPDTFAGAAVDGQYRPFMVQISNANNGVGTVKGGLYAPAPVNGSYADVVYEACQRQGGAETRMSMIFSDTIPDYVGYIRSTRATHPRIRQGWNAHENVEHATDRHRDLVARTVEIAAFSVTMRNAAHDEAVVSMDGFAQADAAQDISCRNCNIFFSKLMDQREHFQHMAGVDCAVFHARPPAAWIRKLSRDLLHGRQMAETVIVRRNPVIEQASLRAEKFLPYIVIRDGSEMMAEYSRWTGS